MGSEVRFSSPRVLLGADTMITSLGTSTAEVLSAIGTGRTGCREVNDPAIFEKPFVAGRIRCEPPAESDLTRLERLFSAVIGDVLTSSGVDAGAENTLLIISSTKGNIDLLTGEGITDKNEMVRPGVMADRIAARVGFRNVPVTISNACISGVSAIVVGARLIRLGRYRNVIVAGGDLLTRFVATGFHAFRSVSETVCRPYDASRDGLTLGEGCGALLLTADPEKATMPHIEVAGGVISGDANHLSAPSRTGDGLYFAIRGAMDEADASVSEIGFVNGHGTGTLYNDEMESRAFALAGLDAVPVNGLKPYFGHTLGAAGVVETIVCAHGLRTGTVYGTPGFEFIGTPHPLDVSPHHRQTGGVVCVKTASGFGGCNAAIVLRKLDGKAAGETTRAQARIEPAIRETARVRLVPDGRPFGEMIRERFRALGSPDMKFFKMDGLSKLGYVAVGELLHKAGFANTDPLAEKYPPEKIGLILANRSASLDTDTKHQRQTEQGDASPAVFVYTLPNVAAGEISIRHKIQGESTFFIEETADEDFAGEYARMLLHTRRLDAVIVGRLELSDAEFNAELTLLETK